MYFVQAGDTQKGPYTEAQLRSMWSLGAITADAVCWKDGMEAWVPVAEVVGDTVSPQRSGIPAPKGTSTDALTLPPGSQYRRVFAFLLDLAVMSGLMFLGEHVLRNELSGPALQNAMFAFGAAYLMVRDALFRGRSVGKFVFRLVVLDVSTGKPTRFGRAFLRNALPVGLVLLFVFVGATLDHFGGRVGQAAGMGGVLASLIFCYRGFGEGDFRTMGDETAGTYVVNYRDSLAGSR